MDLENSYICFPIVGVSVEYRHSHFQNHGPLRQEQHQQRPRAHHGHRVVRLLCQFNQLRGDRAQHSSPGRFNFFK